MNILYLGLHSSHFPEPGHIVHYPVIQISARPKEEILPHFKNLHTFTHFLFTSKTSVDLFFNLLTQEKISVPAKATWIAIGPITKDRLEQQGIKSLIPSDFTQEGMIQLLSSMDGEKIRPFLPHSSIARKKLIRFLRENRFDFVSISLYDTAYVEPEQEIEWEKINLIAFTSPSTVKGFFRIHSHIPEHIRIWCQGAVTKAYLEKKRCEKSFKQLSLLS